MTGWVASCAVAAFPCKVRPRGGLDGRGEEREDE